MQVREKPLLNVRRQKFPSLEHRWRKKRNGGFNHNGTIPLGHKICFAPFGSTEPLALGNNTPHVKSVLNSLNVPRIRARDPERESRRYHTQWPVTCRGMFRLANDHWSPYRSEVCRLRGIRCNWVGCSQLWCSSCILLAYAHGAQAVKYPPHPVITSSHKTWGSHQRPPQH